MTDDTRTVLILTTGGTIDKSYFDALSAYQVGESQVARILQVARNAVPIEIRELFRKDSLELTDEDRAVIAETVAAAPQRSIVITHGTDTLTRTAAAIGRPAGKTIALVGALAPARFSESDAPFNLGMALATAQIAPPGVYITMNGTVFDAATVRKDRDKGAFVTTA